MWKSSLNGYCLNFKGRVREASIKNFQLVDEAQPLDLVMQATLGFPDLKRACLKRFVPVSRFPG